MRAAGPVFQAARGPEFQKTWGVCGSEIDSDHPSLHHSYIVVARIGGFSAFVHVQVVHTSIFERERSDPGGRLGFLNDGIASHLLDHDGFASLVQAASRVWTPFQKQMRAAGLVF
jgi:hypothetical protein